jgi:phospholipid/cholesterol/gamma-HCH transport system permease protein
LRGRRDEWDHVAVISLLALVGQRVRSFLFLVGNLSWLVGRSLRAAFDLDAHQLKVVWEQTVVQIRFTGLDALPFVLGAGFGVGAITIIQAYTVLSTMAEHYIGSLLVVIVVRELGPLTAAVLVIGRSGTAIAADLGAMRLNQEVDALEAFGVDPFQYLLLPRLLGVTFSLFALLTMFDAAALLGGYAVAGPRFGLPWATFVRNIQGTLENLDLMLALAKSVFFGAGVALVSCYYGLAIQRSQTEIPRAVTRTVVVSLTCVLAIDTLIAALVYA